MCHYMYLQCLLLASYMHLADELTLVQRFSLKAPLDERGGLFRSCIVCTSEFSHLYLTPRRRADPRPTAKTSRSDATRHHVNL